MFVGRTAEFTRALAAADSVRAIAIHGLAGVGKTSFALRVAEAIGATHGAAVRYLPCAAGETLRSLARQLGADDDPIQAMLRAEPYVMVVDDVHLARDATVVDGLAHVAALRRNIWIVAASRVRVDWSPLQLDHATILLDVLSEEESKELWARLVELYGTPARPPLRRDAAGRLPWTIKRAFAERAPDLAEAILDGLGEPARELLGLLTALRVPIGRLEVDALLGSCSRQALDELAKRFLVEELPDDQLRVHDLVREALAGSTGVTSREAHHRCARWLESTARGESDAELIYQRVRAGDFEQLRPLLSSMAEQHFGLAWMGTRVEVEMLAALEAMLPAAGGYRETSLEGLRLRLLLRSGAPPEPLLAGFARLADTIPSSRLDAGLALIYAAHYREAVERLVSAANDLATPLPHRVIATFTAAAFAREFGEDVVDRLHGALPPQLEPLFHGVLHAIAEHHGGRPVAGHRHYDTVLGALPFPAHPIVAPFMLEFLGSMRAAAGVQASSCLDASFDSNVYGRTGEMLLRAEQGIWLGDPRMARWYGERAWDIASAVYPGLATWAAYVLVEAASELGGVGATLAVADAVVARASTSERTRARLLETRSRAQLASGDAVGALALAEEAFGVPTLTRVRVRAAGLALLASLEADSAELAPKWAERLRAALELVDGFFAAEGRLRLLEHALASGASDAEGALGLLADEAAAARFHGLATYALVLHAESALARGDMLAALHRANDAGTHAKSRGLMRCELRAELVAAAVARSRNDETAMRELCASVEMRAVAAGLAVEAEVARSALRGATTTAGRTRLVARLGFDAELRHTLSIDGDRVHLTAGQCERALESFRPLVLDEERHALRLEGRVVELDRGPTTYKVVLLLVEAGRVGVSAEQIAKEAMGLLDYHPIRHRSRISMAIARARQVLGAHAVRTVGDRYVMSSAGAATLRRFSKETA